MEKRKKGFWRGFTWKRMLKNFLFLFLLTQFIDVLLTVRESAKAFQADVLLRRLILATILSFLFSLWQEPAMDDKSRNDQPAA